MGEDTFLGNHTGSDKKRRMTEQVSNDSYNSNIKSIVTIIIKSSLCLYSPKWKDSGLCEQNEVTAGAKTSKERKNKFSHVCVQDMQTTFWSFFGDFLLYLYGNAHPSVRQKKET